MHIACAPAMRETVAAAPLADATAWHTGPPANLTPAIAAATHAPPCQLCKDLEIGAMSDQPQTLNLCNDPEIGTTMTMATAFQTLLPGTCLTTSPYIYMCVCKIDR